jgi:GDP-D-mannose 3',5'-epimerase
MPNLNNSIVVCGAGGFIGGHLVAQLRRQGAKHLRGVDIKPLAEWYQHFDDVDNRVLDLSRLPDCEKALEGAHTVYNLAADMGGMGFIELNKGLCMLTVLINTHLLMAARTHRVERFLYSSSACVYAADKQVDEDIPGLKESDAYPAMPEDGYGWEKLFSERMCRHFREDFGLATRIVRYHNVYGPNGTYEGQRGPRNRNLGRRTPDPQLHVHRRLHPRNEHAPGQRFRRSDQRRQQPEGDHQPARRHRGRNCGHQAQAPVQARRAQGRERPQQR